VQLEQSIFVLELYFLLLVELSYLIKHYSSLLVHLEINFFIGLIQADIDRIRALKILLRLLLVQIFLRISSYLSSSA